MRIRRIVVGLVAVAAVAGVAACSSHSSASPEQIAVAADTSSVGHTTTSTSDRTTTTAAPTTTTTTTTKTAPKTTQAPATTKKKTTTTATRAVGVPCSAAAKACVDLSAHKAWLMDDGKVVYGPVSIMPGRPGWRTPTGTFHVLFKNADYFSHEFQVPMPDAVFFYPGIAFHVGSLHTASHGCVHLSRTSALKFFHTLSTGDEVQVVR